MIIARLSGLKVGFYEVGDIRFSRGNGNILSFLENFLSKYFRGVIVTSPSFINEIKKNQKVEYLEELDENSCKWPIGHPNEKTFYFCGRSSLKDFSYCKLHLLYAYQPKGKKEDVVEKEEIPEFIEKKIKSA